MYAKRKYLEENQFFLGFENTWKILTLGFNNEISRKTILNNSLSFIWFAIYKYKMDCRFKKKNMSIRNLKIKVKNGLFLLQHQVLKKACLTNDEKYLEADNYIQFVFLIFLLIALFVV